MNKLKAIEFGALSHISLTYVRSPYMKYPPIHLPPPHTHLEGRRQSAEGHVRALQRPSAAPLFDLLSLPLAAPLRPVRASRPSAHLRLCPPAARTLLRGTDPQSVRRVPMLGFVRQ